MKLSTKNISFLTHVKSTITVDMTSGWRHHYFDQFSTIEILEYILKIKDDSIYLIIPTLSTSRDLSKPRLILSPPFLINNKSNPELITTYILEQYKLSGFALVKDEKVELSFKFKRVWFYKK
jgi:hypothetical protein